MTYCTLAEEKSIKQCRICAEFDVESGDWSLATVRASSGMSSMV
jgi:hypothetical protein